MVMCGTQIKMGFKNDNQRKAVMATLNNGASSRGFSNTSVRKVRFNQANSNSVKLIGKKLFIGQKSIEHNGEVYVIPKKIIDVRNYDSYLRNEWNLSSHNISQLKKHGEFNIRDTYGLRTITSEELKKSYKASLSQKLRNSYGALIRNTLFSKGVSMGSTLRIADKTISQLDIKT